MAHLDNNRIVIHAEVCEEILNVLLARLVGDTTKFNAAMQVFFVKEVLKSYCLLIELVISKALVLTVGHLIELNPTRPNILALLLIHRVLSLLFV